MNLSLESVQDSIRPYYGIGSVCSPLDLSQEHIAEASNETTSIMATNPTVSHKRTRSQVDSESADPSSASTESAPSIRAILIHLSALLSPDAAITYTVRTLLSELLPENEIPQLPDEAILRAFITSPRIYNILRELGMRELTADEMSRMEALYTVIFFTQGWPQLRLDPHAKAFLVEATRQRPHLRLAAMSNNTPKAAELLEKLGVRELERVIPTPAVQAINEGSLAYEAFWDTWKRLIVPWFNDPSSNFAWDDFDKNGNLKADKAATGEKTTDKTNTDKASTDKVTSKDTVDKSTADRSPTPKESTDKSNTENPDMSNPILMDDTPTTTTNQPTDTPTRKKFAPLPPTKSCTPSTCNTNNYHTPNPTTPTLKPSEVMVISCALYDLGIAKLTGMQTCWLRKIKPDDEVAVRVAGNFDMVAGDLEEVRVRLFGGGDDMNSQIQAGDDEKIQGGDGGGGEKEHSEEKDKGKEKGKEVLEAVEEENDLDDDLVIVSANDKMEQAVQGAGEEKEVVMMEIDDD